MTVQFRRTGRTGQFMRSPRAGSVHRLSPRPGSMPDQPALLHVPGTLFRCNARRRPRRRCPHREDPITRVCRPSSTLSGACVTSEPDRRLDPSAPRPCDDAAAVAWAESSLSPVTSLSCRRSLLFEVLGLFLHFSSVFSTLSPIAAALLRIFSAAFSAPSLIFSPPVLDGVSGRVGSLFYLGPAPVSLIFSPTDLPADPMAFRRSQFHWRSCSTPDSTSSPLQPHATKPSEETRTAATF